MLRPGITAGDAIEAAGVFVTLALFLRVCRLGDARTVLALAGAVAFAFGRGLHLAGNSLHDLADSSGAGDPTGLYNFWDEFAGHYVVEGARVLFAASLLLARPAAGRLPPRGGTAPRGGPATLVLLGGAAYGFITAASAIEGQTVPLALPFYALLGAWLIATARAGRGVAEVRRFYVAATAVALLMLAYWGIRNQGFPEFTRTGILRGATPQSDAGAPASQDGE